MQQNTRIWLFLRCMLVGVIVGMPMIRPGVAFAACDDQHQNVEGRDLSSDYGNKGSLYVNNIAFQTLNKAIHRSLFIIHSSGNDVEVGWTANNGGVDDPRVYFEFVANGSDSGPRFDVYLSPDVTYNFRVSAPGAPNGNGNYTWSAYINGYAFDSVILGYDTGVPYTNSERRNTCDTGWASFTNLDRCRSNAGWQCDWAGRYSNLVCAFDNMGDYKYNKIDNTYQEVDHLSGDC